jgi:peptide-methionine (S)-S-oxide reductase
MIRSAVITSGAALLAVCAVAIPLMQGQAEEAARSLPQPAVDLQPAGSAPQTAVFAGGCFWGIQGVFEHVKGVTQAVSGYAGGSVANPSYEQVSSGTTGHAESVKVTYDPSQVSYGTLLRIFFSVGLDPTQKDRQGPDWGTQYRSELFVNGPDQERVAKAYIAQLEAAHVYSRPIATRVDQASPFYPAEEYHQDYLDLHPDRPYIAINDLPKVQALRMLFPDNWHSSATKVARLASDN